MLQLDGKKNPDRRRAVEKSKVIELGEDHAVAAEYRKTTTIFAIQLLEPFEVDTLEGLHTGKAGDYLAVGAAGELYPIDAAVFAATYEKVE
jgi:hypothetical protein